MTVALEQVGRAVVHPPEQPLGRTVPRIGVGRPHVLMMRNHDKISVIIPILVIINLILLLNVIIVITNVIIIIMPPSPPPSVRPRQLTVRLQFHVKP
jgi:hypothetical protein